MLKNLGEEMDEEVKRQAPIMDAIDDKLDSSAEELRTANGKLKRVITDMRSTRHFCIDVILIFIILGVDSTSSTPSASDDVYENLGRRKHHASHVHHNRKNRSPRARARPSTCTLARFDRATSRIAETRLPGLVASSQSSCCAGAGFGGITFSLMAFTYGPATSIPLTTYGSAMVLALAT